MTRDEFIQTITEWQQLIAEGIAEANTFIDQGLDHARPLQGSHRAADVDSLRVMYESRELLNKGSLRGQLAVAKLDETEDLLRQHGREYLTGAQYDKVLASLTADRARIRKRLADLAHIMGDNRERTEREAATHALLDAVGNVLDRIRKVGAQATDIVRSTREYIDAGETDPDEAIRARVLLRGSQERIRSVAADLDKLRGRIQSEPKLRAHTDLLADVAKLGEDGERLAKQAVEIDHMIAELPPVTREQFEREVDRAIEIIQMRLAWSKSHLQGAYAKAKQAIGTKDLRLGAEARTILLHARQYTEEIGAELTRINFLLRDCEFTEYAKRDLVAELIQDHDMVAEQIGELEKVAASIPVLQLPPGATPQTFASFLAKWLPHYPTIGIELAMRADPRSTKDDIGPGVELIQKLELANLIQFADKDNEPCLFVAAPGDYPDDSTREAAMRMVQWFDRSGEFEAREGRIVTEVGPKSLPERTLDQWLEKYPMASRGIASEARVSRHIVENILKQWYEGKLLRFVEGPTKGPKAADIFGLFPQGLPQLQTRTEREVMKAFRSTFDITHASSLVGHGVIPEITVSQWLLESSKDAAKIRELANIESPEVFAAMLYAFERERWISIQRGIDAHGRTTDRVHVRGPREDVERAGAVAQSIIRAFEQWALLGGDVRPTKQAEYVRAIETQYEALAELEDMAKFARQRGVQQSLGISTDVLWNYDIAGLKRAETYCWFPDPIDAVQYAADTLPLDQPRALRDLTEAIAGWWYFTIPLPIKTSTDTSSVAAILWQWTTTEGGTYGLHFSAYVRGSKSGVRGLSPTTTFVWPENETLAQALTGFRDEYRETYDQKKALPYEHDHILMGEEATLGVVEALAKFWWSGARWIQQKKLVYAKGHIERHARKRMEKDRFKRPLSDIQIIQLRRLEVVERPSLLTEGTGRHLTVRFPVAGHWRNQFYPSKSIYQPKWIEPYVKGPTDAPFKRATHRVYVVNR